MKHFIYLDNNLINSYLSQKNNGLSTKTKLEVTDTICESKTTSTTENNTGVDVNMFIMKTNSPGIQELESNLISNSKAGKELVEKIAHDNVFNTFIEMVDSESSLKSKNFDLNDYVKLSGNYKIYDLDNMIDFFTDDTIDVIVQSELKNFKGNDTTKKAQVKTKTQAYKEIRKLLNVTKSALPYNKFIILNDNFIILKDNYLREDVKAIRFSYGSKITLVGRYTNIYGTESLTETNLTLDNLFNSYDNVIKVFLKSTLNLTSDTKIIMPIALYFE
ncbi:MAG: DUF6414 family protein [Sarcina sp.]